MTTITRNKETGKNIRTESSKNTKKELIARAEAAGIEVDKGWPVKAIQKAVEQAEARVKAEAEAEAAKASAKKRASKARSPRQAFLARAEGKMAERTLHRISMPDESEEKKYSVERSETLRVLAILYKNGLLGQAMTDNLELSFQEDSVEEDNE
jgi:hypothetical protein